jgi:hypothetical protein
MEAVRTFKANLKLEGKPCGWCQIPLKLGDDAAVCTGCEREHHAPCWEAKAGCSTSPCANAPLQRLEPALAAAPAQIADAAALPAGFMHCPSCRSAIIIAPICPTCRAITSPDGIYHGPKTNAPGATQALVYGIIGFFICGIILGPIAISKANQAKAAIRSDPTYEGGGLATAGFVMGIIDIIGWAIIMLMRLSSV